MNGLLLGSILLVLFSICTGERGCPPADEITPCICEYPDSPQLTCENLFESETLRTVFLNSARHHYRIVRIKNSIINYIPHEFEDVSIDALRINNLTLTDIFDAPPKALKSLKELEVHHTKVLRGVIWELLSPLTELELLHIRNVSVKVIKQDFSRYASASLKRIVFYGTETRSIKPGVFEKFVNLESIHLEYGDLSELRRDFFPRPFNITVIGINGHPLETLPDGMFTDMPNLSILGLMNNQITTISSGVFGGRADNLHTLSLIGNPIRCDCRIYLMLVYRPYYRLDGECATPSTLKGKQLRYLTDDDLLCR